MKVYTAILLAIILANAGCAERNANPHRAGHPSTSAPPQHIVFTYQPADLMPPTPMREFRGAWITVVANQQDWPSSQNLSVEQQKAELISLLDRAAQLHLNAVIFQVRPACDAMYQSSIEPWSAYLTGIQGKPPQPFYDPLAFAVEEAHKRGLELHAWFNPFRAWHVLSKSPVAANHVSRAHPEWVRHYGDQLWLDPGDPAVRDYVLRVVLDVVKRYDVDGVQFDDYFYPYPEKDSSGRTIPFPDWATWKKYGKPNGFDLENWRRQNINQFVEEIDQGIKATKPWVKFGISPFGIWRPNYPAPIRGMDAYATIYADSRLWLAKGWVDYLAPQLYWPIDQPQQSFTTLLNWWTRQNTDHRNVFSGIYAGKFSANEIARQISATRAQPGATGEIFFHLRSLTDNPEMSQTVERQFNQPALSPTWPWLDSTPPQKPKFFVQRMRNGWNVRWKNSGGETPWLWVLQTLGTNNVWNTQILPAWKTAGSFISPAPEIISVRAVDRAGNLSAPSVVKKISYIPNVKR